MTISEIKNEANRVKKYYKIDAIPVNLMKILDVENIKLEITDFAEYEKNVGVPISGMLYINGDNKIIMASVKDNKQRRNFTTAHELGHYFLHGGREETDKIFVSFRGDSNPRETEANRFAAELLLPDDKVEEEYKLAMFPTASYFAEKFDVSKQAMTIKLEQMGLKYIDL